MALFAGILFVAGGSALQLYPMFGLLLGLPLLGVGFFVTLFGLRPDTPSSLLAALVGAAALIHAAVAVASAYVAPPGASLWPRAAASALVAASLFYASRRRRLGHPRAGALSAALTSLAALPLTVLLHELLRLLGLPGGT